MEDRLKKEIETRIGSNPDDAIEIYNNNKSHIKIHEMLVVQGRRVGKEPAYVTEAREILDFLKSRVSDIEVRSEEHHQSLLGGLNKEA